MAWSTKLSNPMLKFSKYHGAGNDFILLDDRDQSFCLDQIPKFCHRHFGIGADGLILVRPSSIADLDMAFFNADGSICEMCGNGLRCFVHFLRDDLGIVQPQYRIEVYGKVLTVKVEGEKILTFLPPARLLSWAVKVDPYTVYVVNTGIPHAVVFLTEEVDVKKEGGRLCHHPLFQPDGVNVNFVTEQNGQFHYRTYERGVEGETLACGTGAAAVAFVANRLQYCDKEVDMITRSKQVLTIRLRDEIEIAGPSIKVFDGTL